ALLQRRLGIEAVSVLLQEIQPTLEIVWIDRELHSGAAATLIAANRRQLSLVDLTSFAIMHQRGIDVGVHVRRAFRGAGIHGGVSQRH
ncbi:MAG TPA: hypothetical protein VGA18_05075, partial [Rhodothermales bacterium]